MKGDSKGDFTRLTFDELKHYSGVQMQQGRVQLDADWNEEIDIIDHRWRATLEDVVGPNGAPKNVGGFQVDWLMNADGVPDLTLTPGRIYVDGILCELDGPSLAGQVTGADTVSVVGTKAGEAVLEVGDWVEVSAGTARVLGQITTPFALAIAPSSTSTITLTSLTGSLPAPTTPVQVRPVLTYLTQPDLPSPTPIDTTTQPNTYFGNTYVAYLDVFERMLTALDDPSIREVALNGPDTGTRSRTTWQVRLAEMPSMAKCEDVHLPAKDAPATPTSFPMPRASTGVMRARAVPTSDPQTDCLLPAEAGYRRLENQLYRVEIHRPGTRSSAMFKWSRDNGSVAFAWTGTSPDPQTASHSLVKFKGMPQDSAQGFGNGQWIELSDDVKDLSPDGTALGTFVQIATPVDDHTLSVDRTTATGSVDYPSLPRHPKVRRWESKLTATSDLGDLGDGWISLEDGVQVSFPADGWFNKGDYWLIPARTATTDIEWPNDPAQVPLPLLPHGIEHSYCPLAMVYVHSGGTLTIVDCRPKFPALTEISAADVSYDNTGCQLVNATNVQGALDALCRRDDLKHHNRLIHGWGIVGGLQVECSSKGDLWVMVRGGYAVDCNGNDIEIDDTPYDLAQLMLPLQNPLNEGDGELSLVIGLDGNGQVQVTAEPYTPPPSEFDEIFNGTLLLDVINDCVKPFQDFMTAELAKFPGNPPVLGMQELASAFVNLLAQGPNPQAGQNVYISGAEHELLSTFYADLRKWLHSDTFCGLFSKARAYPATSADSALPHAFGMGQQTRIKYRPGTGDYYTIANGTDPTNLQPRINHFKSDLLVEQFDPTGGIPTGPILDFAFSSDGSSIHVIMAATNNADTLYRSGTITQTGLTWSPSVVTFTGVRLHSIEAYTSYTPQGQLVTWLLAVGSGTGLYVIDTAAITGTSMQLQPAASFNATGQLAFTDLYLGLVTGVAVPYASSSAPAGAYDSVKVFLVYLGTAYPNADFTLPGTGTDNVVFGSTSGAELYVAVSAPNKVITGYSWSTSWQRITDANGQPMAVPVDNCPITMAPVWNGSEAMLCWAAQDFYTLNLVDTARHMPVNGWALPMQVGPVDVASSGRTPELVVLNRPSDSILRVPGSFLSTSAASVSSTQTVWSKTIAYHPLATEAYVDLLAGFLQYLKDCFCDHLLVRTNQCTPASQKLYLGCVSIRNSAVYNVCNFSGRHYLKTFPTIGYWLSLFPLMPMISELIELLCCFIIPDAAAGYQSVAYRKPAAGSSPQWSLQNLFSSMQEIQNLNPRQSLNQLLQRFGLARHVIAYSAGFRQMTAPTAPAPAGFVIGQNVIAAQGALAQAGISSQVQSVTPAMGPQLVANLMDVMRAPTSPSGPVVLHQAGGQVVFTSNPAPAATTSFAAAPSAGASAVKTTAPAPAATSAAMPTSAAAPTAQPATAQPTIASLQQQLQAKDAQLQVVQSQIATMSQQLNELTTFRQHVTQLITSGQLPPGGTTPTTTP